MCTLLNCYRSVKSHIDSVMPQTVVSITKTTIFILPLSFDLDLWRKMSFSDVLLPQAGNKNVHLN